jgi:hypothetical protein
MTTQNIRETTDPAQRVVVEQLTTTDPAVTILDTSTMTSKQQATSKPLQLVLFIAPDGVNSIRTVLSGHAIYLDKPD